MNKIYDIRQKAKNFYHKYDLYITYVSKALVMLVVLLTVNSLTGYSGSVTRWNIIAIAILVAALLPRAAITGIAAIFTLVNLYALSWEIALVIAAFLFIAAIMHYVFLPGYGIAIALIPAAYFLHIPYVIPLVLGIVGGTTSFIPAGLGVFFYYFILGIQKNADYFMRTSGGAAGTLERFPQIFSIVKDNKLMIISIIAFCLTTLLVHVFKKMSSDYSSYIAVAVGTIANIVVFLVGGFSTDATVPYMDVFIGSVISFVLAVLIIFWLSAVDYNHTEYLTYEDDDYVYYVKAVPKIKIAAQEIRIHDITADGGENDDIKKALQALDEIEENERK